MECPCHIEDLPVRSACLDCPDQAATCKRLVSIHTASRLWWFFFYFVIVCPPSPVPPLGQASQLLESQLRFLVFALLEKLLCWQPVIGIWTRALRNMLMYCKIRSTGGSFSLQFTHDRVVVAATDTGGFAYTSPYHRTIK
jgi:hypothetical protein